MTKDLEFQIQEYVLLIALIELKLLQEVLTVFEDELNKVDAQNLFL